MISILYFSNTHVRGGVEEHLLTLLRGLNRSAFRLNLVCTPIVADIIRNEVPADVPVLPLELNGPMDLSAALQFACFLRRQGVDILHSHMFQSSRIASPIGMLCGAKVIVETPHVREQWRQGWLKGSFFIDRCVGRTVDHYIAVSQANADYLIRDKGLPAEKISVIYPGSDAVDTVEPPGRPATELRKSLGFGDADPVLVVVGRLEPQKGHRVLLESLPAIRARIPGVRLVCLSDGSLRAELESRVEDLGLSDSVRFVGYQPNLRDWLALADLTVLPSFYEGLPMAAVESMAAGCPVVATAVDGTPEVVLNERTGLTVPPGDTAALAQAICRLLDAPELRVRMGLAGRRWVTERFSRKRLLECTEAFYLRVWNTHLDRRSSHAVNQHEDTPYA